MRSKDAQTIKVLREALQEERAKRIRIETALDELFQLTPVFQRLTQRVDEETWL